MASTVDLKRKIPVDGMWSDRDLLIYFEFDEVLAMMLNCYCYEVQLLTEGHE